MKVYLQNIKTIQGVENVVLTQRDGFPINSAGVWLSQKEIFSVSSASSAIYSVANSINNSRLKSLLVEGDMAKIFLTPLPKTDEYFLTLTAQSKANLGAIYVEARNSVESLQSLLLSSNADFKPPLIFFSQEEVEEILNNFSLKEQDEFPLTISNYNLIVNEEVSKDIENCLSSLIRSVPEVNRIFISLSGGHVISYRTKYSEAADRTLAAMAYSLFDTANRIFWILKKSMINKILCESYNNFLFVYGLNNAILCIEVKKEGNTRIGLLRLLFSSYIKALNELLDKLRASKPQIPSLSFEDVFQSLVVR